MRTRTISLYLSASGCTIVSVLTAQSPLPTNYGMIATGNHWNFDSLRGAPTFTQGGRALRNRNLVPFYPPMITIFLSLFPYTQKSAILMNISFYPTTGWKPFQPRKTCFFFHFLLCFSCSRGTLFEKGGITVWNRFILVSGLRPCARLVG